MNYNKSIMDDSPSITWLKWHASLQKLSLVITISRGTHPLAANIAVNCTIYQVVHLFYQLSTL